MKLLLLAAVGCLLIAAATAEVMFEEKFDDTWDKRWHKSSWKQSDGSAGGFTLTAGKWFGGDEAAAKGIQTGPDSKYHATWAEMKKAYTNKDKELVVQFQVKHEQDLDCGGGYIKLIPASSKSKMKDFGGETPYSIMFGPDICGYSTRKTHVILPYKDKNHLVKKDIKCETDQLSHVYTLRLMPNNTYEVYIDLKKVESGSLYDDFDMLPPKKIKDPKAQKPEDWDEREKIADPEDKKPAGWDDIPATIVDPDAKKPEDWSNEDDGEWEAPTIPNPEYKGEWKPKMIDNPAYKGIWVAPDIDNPEYKHDDKLYLIKDIKYIGFELWQVKSGSIFDNILVTDSIDAALKFGEDTWAKIKDEEKAAFDKVKEAEKAAAETKKAEEGSKDDEDDEYDTEDEDDKAKKDAPSATLEESADEDEKDEL
uniref:Calreticulin n=1 Tax=Ettlia sp. YC001 TaxID=1191503 RepID=A0A6G6CV53_9CHLO|nr:calreticulin 2 [Ettlia sp. YC001]